MNTNNSPRRIRRQREQDWRMPVDAEGRTPVYVGRPGAFGNRHRVVGNRGAWRVESPGGVLSAPMATEFDAAALAVAMFRADLEQDAVLRAKIRAELPGRDVMCWCKEHTRSGKRFPCHGDVILEFAAQAIEEVPRG
ncbi:DUF4326 domain-containing protein [Glycomyces artemisiae]|uniref:Uncharacterized protein DUF4326 n=1 Tax=Glycomyces artemisiae TaxID=1076443 RepID=A0A2T0UF53_9ACTN|nr:DUF4326 domain-containing protein [Glycomyces artemisiae]PRY56478.1 uncharacterized protein DUF4326 [Glycomyces artemisiae]